jgi:hypothetical protein
MLFEVTPGESADDPHLYALSRGATFLINEFVQIAMYSLRCQTANSSRSEASDQILCILDLSELEKIKLFSSGFPLKNL